jgi:hypothetical protein
MDNLWYEDTDEHEKSGYSNETILVALTRPFGPHPHPICFVSTFRPSRQGADARRKSG